jgi:hypothetical protein
MNASIQFAFDGAEGLTASTIDRPGEVSVVSRFDPLTWSSRTNRIRLHLDGNRADGGPGVTLSQKAGQMIRCVPARSEAMRVLAAETVLKASRMGLSRSRGRAPERTAYVVGGDEDVIGSFIFRSSTASTEAVDAGHLDIEEQQIRLEAFDRAIVAAPSSASRRPRASRRERRTTDRLPG